MSETSLVQLEKKRNELETELSSTVQREATLEKELKVLEEEVAAQLEEKIHAKYESVERLESTKNNLEKRLKELKEHPEASQVPDVPLVTGVDLGEQRAEPADAAAVDGQLQNMEDTVSESKEKSCNYCGAENKTDAFFCEKCGKRIE